MNIDPNELELQDYLDGRLDGRLDEAQRAAFERRLREDPALAERVSDLRAIGRALRDDRPALPTGFDARLRERFVSSTRRRRQSFIWPAAGVAAAAIVIAVVYLPGAFHDGVLPPAVTQPSLRSQEAARPEENAVSSSTAPSQTILGDSLTADKKTAGERGAREDRKELAEKTKPEVPSRGGAPILHEMKSDDLASLQTLGYVGGPPANEPMPADSGATAGRLAPAERPAPARAPAPSVRKTEAQPVREAAAPRVLRSSSIPSGTVDHEAVEVIVSGKAGPMSRAKGATGSDLASILRPDFETERLVLVGPRKAPFSCSGAVLVESPNRLTLVLAAPDSRLRKQSPQSNAPSTVNESAKDEEEGSSGCAFVIPRSPVPVFVEGP